MNKFLCLLIRYLFGGSHKWRRLHKAEGVPSGYLPAQIRICDRCLTERVVKQRNRKPKEST